MSRVVELLDPGPYRFSGGESRRVLHATCQQRLSSSSCFRTSCKRILPHLDTSLPSVHLEWISDSIYPRMVAIAHTETLNLQNIDIGVEDQLKIKIF